jgi:phenylacetate-CoA ligase
VTGDTITDADRYPTLTDGGRAMLRFLREHPHAPIFRNESGNRLTERDVDRVRDFEREVLAASVGWAEGDEPQWIAGIIRQCYAEVPFYRRLGAPPAHLGDVPPVTRGDLGRDIAQFVPDSAPIERLINFRTSGTTGHPLLLASHPVVAASYLAFHKRALRRVGVELRHGRGQVGVVLLGFQRECFTYVSVTPTMDEAGLAKINLHERDWRDPADRGRYLEAMAPEVIAGDPISFAELLRIGTNARPRALLCTSMALSPALRGELEAAFDCPVLDLYSLNEAGPVGVYDGSAGGHVLLQHRMFVELLDGEGRSAARGERGEITLSGGFNFCLPLLRYRTGDYASLTWYEGEPVLVGLEGRPPVRFRTTRGEWINNIEVTHAFRGIPLAQFVLHQRSDGSLRLRLPESLGDESNVRDALLALFGGGQHLEIERVSDFGGKVVQYTSELAGALP